MSYGYPQPVQQPIPYFSDSIQFRQFYAHKLRGLTENSKPAIHALSMIAQDFVRWADVVVQCIENHIRRIPPPFKLTAFYLLDAISKNLYEPYARHFGPIVVPLFLDTYSQVDESTKAKMIEMLATWRAGAPNGRELFGAVPQLAIEQEVFGTGTSSDTTRVTSAQVLGELQFATGQAEREMQSNPYNNTVRNQLPVLHQLRQFVEKGLSQDELRQILNQLRNITRPPVQPPPQSYPVAPNMSALPPPTTYPQYSYNHAGPSSAPPQSHPPQPAYPQGVLDVKPSFPPAPPVQAVSAVPLAPTNQLSVPAVSDIANLYSALVKAGVVGAPGAPPVASSNVNEPQPVSTDSSSKNISEHARKLLSQRIELSTTGIARYKPDFDELFLKRTVQCKQCGRRFSDDATGKKKLEDHLDMHFRQKRKANKNVGRGHSRSWFTALDDWIHDVGDLKGKSRADRPLTGKLAAAEEKAKREAELRAMFVVVAPGEEAKPFSCPICKEPMKCEFLEDEEEWVWKNAVKKDDKMYHATCHAEAVISTNTLAARLKNEERESRSRSGTPEVSVSTPTRSTPPRALQPRASLSPSPARTSGLKRKAEGDESSLGGTPPMKKFEVSL
ncbi:hypothetical protein BDM02DRAFT_3189210 [Thelephora ganbajun]|uniref:Uncharacterized protein n=1 Tax=Thelephora ganbajun TaxID=370292 RepID=A0ACB6Z9J7_THEGA|nr:hypothetical protein BDM02DRAFT_3189210 [Thelephora ganbajun]